ncbi:MAG TPA: DMT family transporter [Acidimicrobiia bacterium]|nr:DMT family transporter [Acidimicrobiia bacterium]
MTTRSRLITTAPGTRTEAFGALEWGLLASTSLMWGSSFLWIAEGLEAFPPAVVTLARLALGAATLALFPKTRQPVERADLPRVALLGLVWMAIPLTLFPIAQQWVDSSIAGMVNGGVPIFAAVIAALLLKRRPGRAQIAGIVTGFAGVVLISASSASRVSGSLGGVLLIVLATAMYGLAVNLSVPLAQRYGSLPILLRAQIVALVAAMPFGLLDIGDATWSWSAAGAMVVLGAFSTGIAFVAMTELGKRVGATRGSIGIYFIPIVATILGMVFRDERPAWPAFAGMALVVLGAWWSSRREA